ncbi:hypothetical protein Ndes2526B_g06535 [Nannochloris sp. 'desiccata']
MTDKEKRVSFQSKDDQPSDPGLGGTIASAVETGIGAVAQAGNAVLSHVPGTDEHALHQCKKEIERTGVDHHVADDIAFECGPASHSSSLYPSSIPKEPRTADELAYGTEGPLKTTPKPISSTSAPKDAIHTADDRDFLKGESVGVTSAPPQRKTVDPHTADDLAFTKGVGEGGKSRKSSKEAENGVGARPDVVHTADDLAFTGKEL